MVEVRLPEHAAVPAEAALELTRRAAERRDAGQLHLTALLLRHGEGDDAARLLAEQEPSQVPVAVVRAVDRSVARGELDEEVLDRLLAGRARRNEAERRRLDLIAVRQFVRRGDELSATRSLDRLVAEGDADEGLLQASSSVYLPADVERHRAICATAFAAGHRSTSLATANLLGLVAGLEITSDALGSLVDGVTHLTTIGEHLAVESVSGVITTACTELERHGARTDRRADRASRATTRVDDLLPVATPALSLIADAVVAAGHAAFDALASSIDELHDALRLGAPRLADVMHAWVSAWAVTVRSGGYETWHTHPSGVLSGVLYLAVPDLPDQPPFAGELVFGAPGRPLGGDDLIARARRPRAGDLWIFPSHLHHRTFPSGVDEDRVCLAFDLVPA